MKFVLAAVLLFLAVPATAGVIAIHTSADTRPEVTPAAVTCGVPFPRDTYHPGQPLRLLDDAGAPQPMQARVTATWDPEGRQGVRWLLLDFLAEPARTYTLHLGDQPAPALPALASEDDQAILIDTGAIAGRIPKRGFDPFSGLTVNGQPIVQPPGQTADSQFNGFYVEHEKLGILRADLDPDATVVLEENGPIRACVKADGWYVNAAGDRFGRYSLRLHFFRGSSSVRVLHTFIYTGLSPEDRVVDLGLQLEHCAASYPQGYTVWGTEPLDAGQATSGHNRPETPHVALVQDSFDRDHLEFKQLNLDTGEVMAWGEKLAGYLQYIARPVVLTAVLKDAWQQYPFEFELDDRCVRLHFWPKHGRVMDLSWDGYWWWLTERQKRYLANQKQHKEQDLDVWMQRLRDRTNATGAAKTHELWLNWRDTNDYSRPNPPPSAWEQARAVDQPLLAQVDPVWSCATRALDWCLQAPPDASNYDDEQRYAHALLNLMQTAVARRHYYGFWDWGGYHQHLFAYQPGRREDDGGLGLWHRARPKSHYGWGTFAWLNAFRGGGRSFLRYAQTYTLYSADRAHCHHTAHGRNAGAEYHYDNSEIHWLGGWRGAPGGDVPSSNLQQKDDYLFAYWMTGDRRALDVLELWGRQMIEQGHFTGAWIDNLAQIADGNQNRNAGMALHRLCLLYQATWDQRYLAAARRLADGFARIDSLDKLRHVETWADHVTLWHASSGWVYDGLWQYWNLTGDPRIRHTLLIYCQRAADHLSGSVHADEFRVFSAFTYGYELTRDEKYLNLGKALCNRLVGNWINTASFHPIPKGDNVVMMRFVGAMAQAPQAWRDRHLPTHLRGDFLDYRYAPRRDRPSRAPARLHLLETTDGDWTLEMVFDGGGEIEITGPAGQVVLRQQVDRLNATRVTLAIPRDGVTGVYTVTSPGLDPDVDRTLNHGYSPHAFVLNKPAEMKLVVEMPQSLAVQNPLRARFCYFQAPALRDDLAVLIKPVHGAQRQFFVEQVDGPWRQVMDAQLPDSSGCYTIALPRTEQPQMYRLRADTPADQFFTGTEGAGEAVLLRNLPPYVSATPEEWFAPSSPQ